MPNPVTNTGALGELLRYLFGIESSKSPLGIPEYVIPPGLAENLAFKDHSPDAMAYTEQKGRLDDSISPYIAYKQKFANDPTTRRHERIHAGQYLLKNHPSYKDTIRIFGSDSPGVFTEEPNLEVPAYNFELSEEDKYKRSKDQPELTESEKIRIANKIFDQRYKYADYMDLLSKINPEGTYTVEAAMPQSLAKDRLKEWPTTLRYNLGFKPLFPPLFPPKVIK